MSGQTNNKNASGTTQGGRLALDPTKPSLAQPWKRLVDEGFITELSVRFTPTGVTVVGKPDKRICDVEGSGLVLGQDSAVGLIKAAADKGNLIPRRQTGKGPGGSVSGTPLPAKSLVKSDFTGSEAELLGRARKVAQACGGQTLVGRVRSTGAFDGEVTTSFKDWWASATPDKKAKSLVQPRHLAGLTRDEVAKLAKLECPFRGTADFVVADEGDEEEEQEAPRPSTAKK